MQFPRHQRAKQCGYARIPMKQTPKYGRLILKIQKCTIFVSENSKKRQFVRKTILSTVLSSSPLFSVKACAASIKRFLPPSPTEANCPAEIKSIDTITRSCKPKTKKGRVLTASIAPLAVRMGSPIAPPTEAKKGRMCVRSALKRGSLRYCLSGRAYRAETAWHRRH